MNITTTTTLTETSLFKSANTLYSLLKIISTGITTSKILTLPLRFKSPLESIISRINFIRTNFYSYFNFQNALYIMLISL